MTVHESPGPQHVSVAPAASALHLIIPSRCTDDLIPRRRLLTYS